MLLNVVLQDVVTVRVEVAVVLTAGNVGLQLGI